MCYCSHTGEFVLSPKKQRRRKKRSGERRRLAWWLRRGDCPQKFSYETLRHRGRNIDKNTADRGMSWRARGDLNTTTSFFYDALSAICEIHFVSRRGGANRRDCELTTRDERRDYFVAGCRGSLDFSSDRLGKQPRVEWGELPTQQGSFLGSQQEEKDLSTE